MDPFSDPRLVSRSIFSAVFEPLAEETAFGTRPAIAETWTNPAPDTWALRIAPHPFFHDGTRVTSRDVVDAAHASRTATATIAGLADLRAIEVVDERTVRFRTNAPAEDFLLVVSALFVPRRDGARILGTGPYRVVAHTPDRLVLRRHRRPGHPEPVFEEVVLRRFASASEGLRLMRRAGASAALDPSPAMVREARLDPRFRVATSDPGGLTYLAVGFTAGAGPIEDVRARRALRLCLDLPELVAAGTVVGGAPAGQLVPPGAFGYDPGRRPPQTDVAEARRLLTEAGYPRGFEATLDVNPNGVAAGNALARQAAGAGIRLHVALHPPDAFVARIDGGSPLYLYSWFVGSDAGQALRNVFHTRDSQRGLGT
jgi:peptide/nickel transport system substrate-binding protein